MRKIIVLAFMTMDGVIQAPGGPKEDTSGGFKYGGWIVSYGDDVFNKVLKDHMKPADLLLGRKTFEIWANYWPKHSDGWPGINEVTKYVVSRTLKKSDPLVLGWKNSVVLRTVSDIKKLKSVKLSGSTSADIKIWGSSKLVQTLLKNDLVDELWLKIFPLTLGKGKKLFDKGAISAAFKLMESTVTPNGVIMANYRRAGKVETGTVGS